MGWQTTDPYRLIATWRTGTDVEVALQVFDDTPGETARVTDVRPYAGFAPAIVLETGAFLSGMRNAPRITWREVD